MCDQHHTPRNVNHNDTGSCCHAGAPDQPSELLDVFDAATGSMFSRRSALLKGLLTLGSFSAASALLAGCASGKPRTAAAIGGAHASASTDNRLEALVDKWSAPSQDRSAAAPRERSPWKPLERPSNAMPTGVIARSQWAAGEPVPRLMDQMKPITRVTVHHDALGVFNDTSQPGVAQRLEAIRRGHRSKGWGDIGYHFAVDPAGRVWQCRPLAWQGAHVKDHNEGNVGVVLLGDFERQRPTSAQTTELGRFVAQIMHQNRVSVRDIYTHRELGRTACAGKHVQTQVIAMRRPGGTFARASA